jgi:hypothetical protein
VSEAGPRLPDTTTGKLLDTDVRELDVEGMIGAFRAADSDLSPETRETYVTRFRKAVEMYHQWLDDPEPRQSAAPALFIGSGSKDGDPSAVVGHFTTNFDRYVEATLRRVYETPDLVPHLFPLQGGGTALLTLPHPLSRSEAERLSQFVLSLATEPSAAPTTDPAPDLQFVDADGNHTVVEVKKNRVRRPVGQQPRDEDG